MFGVKFAGDYVTGVIITVIRAIRYAGQLGHCCYYSLLAQLHATASEGGELSSFICTAGGAGASAEGKRQLPYTKLYIEHIHFFRPVLRTEFLKSILLLQ